MLSHTAAQAATDCASTKILEADCNALMYFWNTTGGAQWTNAASDGWNKNNLPCSWQGVTCELQNNAQRVIGIELVNNNLTGKLAYFGFTALRKLILANNKLTGEIPYFSDMKAIEALDLQSNQLTGTLPYFEFPALQVLNLSNNQLSGEIPYWDGIKNLQTLVLSKNQLTGSIPYWDGFTALQTLALSHNQLSGTIPYVDLPALQSLDLSHNQLTGNVPYFAYPALQQLDLSSNQLTGTIPDLGSLINLQKIALADNQLNGQILNLASFTALKQLSLSHNQLSGNTPTAEDLAILQNLENLQLDNNCIRPSTAEIIALLNSKNPNWRSSQPSACDVVRLVNISARCTIATAPNNSVAGFIVAGSGTKKVLLRAIRSAAEPNVNFDLQMTLYRLNGAQALQLASNNNWQDGNNALDIAALPANLIPRSKLDAALIADLEPGVYTIEAVSAQPNSSGIGTIGVDDLDDHTTTTNLINISGRCRVGSTASDHAVAGFVIAGQGNLNPLLRGIKSAIEPSAIDPKMSLYKLHNGQFQLFADNDNWRDHSSAAQIENLELAAHYVPKQATDAAILQTLEAGVYTLNVSTRANAGVATIGVDLLQK